MVKIGTKVKWIYNIHLYVQIITKSWLYMHAYVSTCIHSFSCTYVQMHMNIYICIYICVHQCYVHFLIFHFAITIEFSWLYSRALEGERLLQESIVVCSLYSYIFLLSISFWLLSKTGYWQFLSLTPWCCACFHK